MTFPYREIDRLLLVLGSMAVLAVIAMATHGWVSWTAVSLVCLLALGITLFVVARLARTGGAS